MALYEVAILEIPSKNDREEGKPERLVYGPKAVVATDPQSAAIAIVMDDKEGVLKGVDRSRMQVLIRAFAQPL